MTHLNIVRIRSHRNIDVIRVVCNSIPTLMNFLLVQLNLIYREPNPIPLIVTAQQSCEELILFALSFIKLTKSVPVGGQISI